MDMEKLQIKMQLAATVLFALVFGSIFISSIILGHSTDTTTEQGSAFVTVVKAETESPEEKVIQNRLQEYEEKNYIYYDVPLENDFQEYVQDICRKYGFDRYDIIIALIGCESDFQENAISPTDDYGYMQINEINHEWLSNELEIVDFLDGEQNVIAGVYMLSNLYSKYDDIGLALMCYNCGEKGARRLWEQGIYSTNYSRKVIETAECLKER